MHFIGIDVRSHRLIDSADDGKVAFPVSIEVFMLKSSAHEVLKHWARSNPVPMISNDLT